MRFDRIPAFLYKNSRHSHIVNMKRILHITHQLKRNGTETFIMNLFRNIDRKKFTFDFLVFSDSGDGYREEALSLGGHIFTLPSRRDSILRHARALDDFFRTHATEYDAVHYHAISFTTVMPVWYAKKYGVRRRIMHIHGVSCQEWHNRLLHCLNRRRLPNLATDFLACSREAALWGYGGTKCLGKASIITNGIDTDKFRFNPEIRQRMRQELGLDGNIVIGHVGSFNTIKNQAFLLRLLRHMLDNGNNAILLCVGQGELLEKTRIDAEQSDLDNHILFMGERKDVEALLQTMDIMVMPSLHEGLGLALIEAQAAGLPAVASTGVPEAVKTSPFTEFLSLDAPVGKWCDTILRLAMTPRTVTADSNDMERYSISKTVDEMQKIYENDNIS